MVGNTANMARASSSQSESADAAMPMAATGGPLRAVWSAVVAVTGAVTGLAPHVLHHVGFLAGAALIAGTGGTLLFGVLGLLASIPMLLRLRRRFASWWVPGIALVVFVLTFSLSAFVIGPRTSGGGAPTHGEPNAPVPAVDHASHHRP
ncbi:MAG TPA: hypothetical protein VFP72_02945 [Kineosporiaceae bacterium]|nr:hypothetical protein [Kineosporiaceae bacterium]